MKLFMQLLLVLLFLTFCGVFSLISPKKVLAEFCLVCDPIGGCFQYICDNPEPPGGWPHIVPPSGRDKGVTMRPFLDRYSNQDSHDNRPFIPSYIYDVNNERFEINEDSIQGRKGFSFSGNMTIVPFGPYSIYDDGKHFCFDSGLGNATFNMTGTYGYACEGSSCGNKMRCKEYAHIARVPQAYIDQGFKPAKFYTIEPVNENAKVELLRKTGQECVVPLNTEYGPYFLTNAVYGYCGKKENRQWFSTETFEIYETIKVAPDVTYRRVSGTDVVRITPYYRKQNGDGSWPDWSFFYSNVTFIPGNYQLAVSISARLGESCDVALYRVYISLDTCCIEEVDWSANALVCPDNGASSYLAARLPEYTDMSNPIIKDLRGEIFYTLTWNFQPNFSSDVDIPLRIVNLDEVVQHSLPVPHSYSLKYLDTQETVANIRTGSDDDGAPSKTFFFKPDKNRQYQLEIRGNHTRYSNGDFFTFLAGGAKRKMFPTGNLYDHFVDYFVEGDQSFIFLPLVNQTPIKGTVVGNVYQTSDNICTGTDVPDSTDDWQVQCKRGDEDYQNAREDSASQFTCQIDGETNFDIDGSSYTVIPEAPSDGWQLADCSPSTDVVTLQGGINTVGPFYIWQGGDPWLQTVDGDVGAQGSLAFSLPSDEYLAIVNLADTPGVVSYQSGNDFGEGTSSTEEWLAETALSPKGRTFSGFMTLLGNPTAEGSSFTNLSSLSTGTYFYDNDISIGSGDNLFSGNKVILLVGGDVTIDADLTVAEDDFLAIIASGNITFTSEVTQSQGIFFAGDQIIITESETQFLGEGMFLAANGFSFGRDLETSFNLEPAEIFTFRPDLLINSPSELWVTPQTWQEVAP